MQVSAEQCNFLHLYQQHYFHEREEGRSSHDRADDLRCQMALLHYANTAGFVSETATSSLMEQHAEAYAILLDLPAEKQGLDNYAEAALTISQGNKNESQLWTSSLDMETADQLECIHNLREICKASSEMLIPSGCEQDLIHIESSTDSKPTNFRSDALVTARERTGPAQVSSSHTSHQPLFRTANQQQSKTVNNTSSNPGFFKSYRSDISTDGHDGVRGPIPERESSRFGVFSSAKSASTQNNSRNFSLDSFMKKSEAGGKRSFYEAVSDGQREPSSAPAWNDFKTAREQLIIENQKKYSNPRDSGGTGNMGGASLASVYGTSKRSLGTRRGTSSKFVPPVMNKENDGMDDRDSLVRRTVSGKMFSSSSSSAGTGDEVLDERLKNIEPKMVELIMNEIMENGPPITWKDIAGLEFAKNTIMEIVVWPMLRPDIFTGLRGPPKGLLLFGPPGTGKTLIGKCIASQSKSTFFSISASSLTSKWVGEGEKMVRALFAVARCNQPAVVFIDEIDSLLSQRSDGEHEASRRIKTEFLVQLDGATTGNEDRILVVGATNRPQEIDEAARRRFVKRLYIPLPESAARRQIVSNLMKEQAHHLSESEIDIICSNTDGFSGADMATLCREAALGPIRSIALHDIENISADQVRPILFKDFEAALKNVRASVSQKDLDVYLQWNAQYGSGSR